MTPYISRILSFAATLAIAASAQAFAQTQADLNAAAGRDFTKSNKKLYEIYQQLMAKISPKGQARLRDAENTWFLFRNQECYFETLSTDGGSIHPMLLLNCQTRLTDRRIKDLEDQLNCKEGDLSCGGQ